MARPGPFQRQEGPDSPGRPVCPYCHKPLPRATHTHFFGQSEDRRGTYSSAWKASPRNREEAQRIVGNGEIVSSSRNQDGTLYSVGVWDQVNYVVSREVFCTNRCAAAFGLAAYRAGYRRT